MGLLRQPHFFTINIHILIIENADQFTLNFNSVMIRFDFAKFANIFLAKMILTFNYRLK